MSKQEYTNELSPQETTFNILRRQASWLFGSYIFTTTATATVALAAVALPLAGIVNAPDAALGGLGSSAPLAIVSAQLGNKSKEARDKLCKVAGELSAEN